ncbi:nucleotidyltransferase family protein [Candidatus Pelagibacter ubique]|jgi:hypothetical protein|nr:nucleotidyltransferase family protein [Candidatus Pelagibacter ubique]
MNFKISKVEKLLCLCIRHCDFLEKEQIRKLYFELGDNIVYESAKLNQVQSIVAHALIICLNKDKLPLHWSKEYKKIEKRIISYMDELSKVADLLAKHNIPLLALKNSGIAIGMYPYYGACPMGDVDVLVRKNQFREAHQILVESGYKLKFRCEFEEDNIEAAEHGGGAEYSVQLDNGEHLWFELQWRPIAGRWIQPKQEPRADELVDRSISIRESNVRLLSPEDNLLQVALHTAKHTFVRAPGFRLHTDVDRIISTQNIDWKVFEKMVLKLKTKTAVYISLSMARDLLGTKVPKDVLKSIQPNKLKTKIMLNWLIRVGIFEPDAHKWNKVGYIIFVSLLYDTWYDFLSGVFPSSANMKSQYGYSSGFLTPYYHVKRLLNLIFKRANL